MLPYTARNWRPLVFTDKIEAAMLDTNLRNTFKSYLSKCIYKRIDCSFMPDYSTIRESYTQPLRWILYVFCWHMRFNGCWFFGT